MHKDVCCSIIFQNCFLYFVKVIEAHSYKKKKKKKPPSRPEGLIMASVIPALHLPVAAWPPEAAPFELFLVLEL